MWTNFVQYFASYNPSNIGKMSDFVVKWSRSQTVPKVIATIYQ